VNRDSLPIIHIIGLPGSGKTTLAKKLARKLKLPFYRIGEYRSNFPATVHGEADAWVALLKDLSKRKWKNCILETTGLNCRESFLRVALPMYERITIRLEARRKVLYERIKKKKKNEEGGDWLFSADYRNKYEFVKKMFRDFERIPADIRIKTSNLKPQEVYKIALDKLGFIITYCERISNTDTY